MFGAIVEKRMASEGLVTVLELCAALCTGLDVTARPARLDRTSYDGQSFVKPPCLYQPAEV